MKTSRVPGTPAQRWVIRGLIPAGAIVAVTDLDDPPPDELIAAGVDVVLRLHASGAMTEAPVLLEAVWRPGLVPALEPPAPFWVQRLGDDIVRVDEGLAA